MFCISWKMHDKLLLIYTFFSCCFTYSNGSFEAFEDTQRNDITGSKNAEAGPARTLTCTIYALILYMAAL